jgi:hypothetical protein
VLAALYAGPYVLFRIAMQPCLWPMRVDSGGSIAFQRTAEIGASRPLRRIPAIVSFLNPQPALSLVGGNGASC